MPRARSGTAIIEWTPSRWRRPSGERASRSASHWSNAGSPAWASTGRPSRRATAGGVDGRYSSDSPGFSAAPRLPSTTERWATRRSSVALPGAAGGSCAPRTQSSRSTVAKSAYCGTRSSISSSAVRTTSSVVPMRVAASLSRARRRRAQYCSLLSKAARATAVGVPAPSRSGHISMLRACAPGTAEAAVKLS